MEGNIQFKGRSAALGSDPQRPIPIGISIKADTERGYGVEMAVMEVLRGKEAEERILSQRIVEGPPPPGLERILVRVRFGYFRRGKGLPDGGNAYRIAVNNFQSTSADGAVEYDLPDLMRQPEPGLVGVPVACGETREGWVVLQLPAGEDKALLSFHREYAQSNYVLIHTWRPIWFRLFTPDPMEIKETCEECRP
ncbi:MAG: hypothetical protein JXD19_12850 [Deltaproteobacteria bacterium]|nr:hypothetical protein [Deltaproteobacteria bacterium]